MATRLGTSPVTRLPPFHRQAGADVAGAARTRWSAGRGDRWPVRWTPRRPGLFATGPRSARGAMPRFACPRGGRRPVGRPRPRWGRSPGSWWRLPISVREAPARPTSGRRGRRLATATPAHSSTGWRSTSAAAITPAASRTGKGTGRHGTGDGRQGQQDGWEIAQGPGVVRRCNGRDNEAARPTSLELRSHQDAASSA